MVRLLALLCCLAVLLAPIGPAWAGLACATGAGDAAHRMAHAAPGVASGADHRQAPAQDAACKLLCAGVVAVLMPPGQATAQPVLAQPRPRPAAQRAESQVPGPGERPPKARV